MTLLSLSLSLTFVNTSMTRILSQNNREGKVMIGDLRGEGGRGEGGNALGGLRSQQLLVSRSSVVRASSSWLTNVDGMKDLFSSMQVTY